MENKYQVVNGTAYHKDTDPKVIEVLERCRNNNTRIVLDYGDRETGRSWGDRHDITGRIGRSTGTYKIPILLHNSRSTGGVAVLDHCIIGIKTSLGKVQLYKLEV